MENAFFFFYQWQTLSLRFWDQPLSPYQAFCPFEHPLSSLKYRFPKSCCHVDENCPSLWKQTKPIFYYRISLLMHFLLPFIEKNSSNQNQNQNQKLPHILSHLIVSLLDHLSSDFHMSPHICSFKGLSVFYRHPVLLLRHLSPNVDKDGHSL